MAIARRLSDRLGRLIGLCKSSHTGLPDCNCWECQRELHNSRRLIGFKAQPQPTAVKVNPADEDTVEIPVVKIDDGIIIDDVDDVEDDFMRKSSSIRVHQMPLVPEKESYTYEEMSATPGIYIESTSPSARFLVLRQFDNRTIVLFVSDGGMIAPIPADIWKDCTFYEANDDLMVMFTRPVA